jgi:branched-chain amino acid transport system substrate-binding protein
MQYLGGETKIVWPSAIKTAEPLLPIPKSSAYSK